MASKVKLFRASECQPDYNKAQSYDLFRYGRNLRIPNAVT